MDVESSRWDAADSAGRRWLSNASNERLKVLHVKEEQKGIYPKEEKSAVRCAVLWYMRRERQRVSAKCSLNDRRSFMTRWLQRR